MGENEVEDNKISEVLQKLRSLTSCKGLESSKDIHPPIDVGMLIIRKLKQLKSRRVPL